MPASGISNYQECTLSVIFYNYNWVANSLDHIHQEEKTKCELKYKIILLHFTLVVYQYVSHFNCMVMLIQNSCTIMLSLFFV